MDAWSQLKVLIYQNLEELALDTRYLFGANQAISCPQRINILKRKFLPFRFIHPRHAFPTFTSKRPLHLENMMLYTLEDYPNRTSMSTAKINPILVAYCLPDLNIACSKMVWCNYYLQPIGLKFVLKHKKIHHYYTMKVTLCTLVSLMQRNQSLFMKN